jgi:hypothetical protein
LANKAIKILEVPFTFRRRNHGETKRNLLAFVFSYAVSLVRLRLLSARSIAAPELIEASRKATGLGLGSQPPEASVPSPAQPGR